MTNEQIDSMTTKISLIVGSITATITLAQLDLIMAIILKGISIISFTLVIAINAEKLFKKLKEWTK